MSHVLGAPIGPRASLSVIEMSPTFTKPSGHGLRFLRETEQQSDFAQVRTAALVPATDGPIALDAPLAADRDVDGLSRFLLLPVLAEPERTLRRDAVKVLDSGPSRFAPTSTRTQG